MEPATDYQLDPKRAELLAGACLLPASDRRKILDRAGIGRDELIDILVAVLGMANSVAANCREMAELVLMMYGGCWPQQAEQINLPTMFGAFQGVGLADGIDPAPTCAGCAYRLGTIANQSPATTCDADHVQQDRGLSGHFFCHDGVGEDDEATRACAGYAQKIR